MNEAQNVEQIRTQALALQAIREEQRRSRPLWERLRRAQDKARMLSTVPSGGISEYTTRGKTEGKEPPQQQETALKDHLALVEHAVELYEDAVAAECGLGAGKTFALMDREEKDAELLKWRGVKSWVVAAKAPWLGDTPRTIERARERLGVKSSNGLDLDPEQKRKWEERNAA
jgi:hypothetical protein